MTDRPKRVIALPDWSRTPHAERVWRLLEPARWVGGAVRDTLLGRAVGDLDLATPHPPGEVIRRLEAAGIRAVPTGVAHGTVTAVTDSGTIEVTTLRRDIETDGRHARIAFTTEWTEDAARRDFTMNALYLDRAGGIWDWFGGIEDCLAGQVVFIGEPAARIREDRLRILRFYRFLAQLGDRVVLPGEDDPGRLACRAAAPTLARLSGERIRVELLKLLAAADPVPALRLMVVDGLWRALAAYPPGCAALSALLALEPASDALRRLAILIMPEDAVPLAHRLRLSVVEAERLQKMASVPDLDLDLAPGDQKRAIYRLGKELYRDRVLVASARAGRADRADALLDLANTWNPPDFPLRGRDLVTAGMTPGPQLGRRLAEIEEWWIATGFAADRAACLARLHAAASD